MKSIKQTIRNGLRSLGYDVLLYTPEEHPIARRKHILELFGVDTVLDVGANKGQYGSMLRQIGYRGRILSFEPLIAAFTELSNRARNDKLWECFNYALGDTDGPGAINVAGNSHSSSIRAMLPSHLESDPCSAYVGKEHIHIKRLDSLFESLQVTTAHVLLKLDTQGFEKNVLDGAAQSLQHINTVEMEMSMESLYQGSLLFPEMYQLMLEKGYRPVSIEDEFRDKTSGLLLQVQATFHRFA